MLEKIKFYWDWFQSMLDIDGDVWMGLLTAIYAYRIVAVLWGKPPVTVAEATLYSAAVGAFAYSNKGKQQ